MDVPVEDRTIAADDPAEESERRRAIREVRDGIDRRTRGNGDVVTGIPGLVLHRKEAASDTLERVYEPSIALVVQGEKRILLGDETYAFGPGQLLVTAVDLPVEPQIVAASAERPYLCLSLKLDPAELAHLMTDGRLPPPRRGAPSRAMAVTEAPAPLIDAFRRLLGVLDSPQDVPMLAPLILREILYRLLVSEQGEQLREAASVGSHAQRIAQAIAQLKGDLRGSLEVEELAERVGMGTSTFYRHFRAVTSMSPVQYRKRLRLGEAQRLMVSEGLDAANAGFRVGYESPSQFSREYRRQFGEPPARHVAGLMQVN